jgi:hypothetical protein
MKKIVLFICFIIASIFVFGQTNEEISGVIIKRGNLDSLFDAKNSQQLSEIEKDAFHFLQDTDEFRQEVLQPSGRMVSEAKTNVGGNNKSPSLLKILVGVFVFALFFIFVPIIASEWSMYIRPRKKY